MRSPQVQLDLTLGPDLGVGPGPQDGPRLVADAEGREWSAGWFPREWRRGLMRYLPMARAAGDPSRMSRSEKHAARVAEGRHRLDYEWPRLRKLSVSEWAKIVLQHLDDGEARSANRMGVELCDQTADVMPPAFYEALIELALRGFLEHTLDVPILWRARKPSHDSVTMLPLPRPCTNPRCACTGQGR